MVWRCKNCGSKKFKVTIVETIVKYGVEFDETGLEARYDGDNVDTDEVLECMCCGKPASKFNFIEDIANQVEE